MADHRTPGERTSLRAAARMDGLQRKGMEDGGEVYTGPLARAALRAVGARAMTLDNTIFVDESFDASAPEDRALYAHERVHQRGSGGSDQHGAHDAEEAAARAIERMVLHRAAAGEDLGTIMRDAPGDATSGNNEPDATAQDAGGQSAPASPASEAASAYSVLVANGQTHDMIVRDLARHVTDQIEQTRRLTAKRVSGSTTL